MSICLWCKSEMLFEPDWTTLFWPPKPKKICEICEEKLIRLEGNLCSSCGGKTSAGICADCAHWSRHSTYHDTLTFNRAVFTYNETLQEMIAVFKYRGDYELWRMFEHHLAEVYQTHFSYLGKNVVLVPIPLSEKRLQERAFNQAEALASALPLSAVPALKRREGEKQSKKTRRERMTSGNPFFLNQSLQQPVILVDDIYTTGTTLRQAASVLKENGCPAVYALTLAR